MAEDVHEQATVGTKPPVDATQELPVVPHVLEHLDTDYPVESTGQLQVVHVGGDHAHVGRRPSLDEEPLRHRVGDRGDQTVRIRPRHVQGERPPSAAQLEDVLSVLEHGALTGELEHRLLGRFRVSTPSGQ